MTLRLNSSTLSAEISGLTGLLVVSGGLGLVVVGGAVELSTSFCEKSKSHPIWLIKQSLR